MTLEDIEVASVSSLRQKETPGLCLSPSLSRFLKCLIRGEIYWPAFHFTASSTARFREDGQSFRLILHLYVIRNRGSDMLITGTSFCKEQDVIKLDASS